MEPIPFMLGALDVTQKLAPRSPVDNLRVFDVMAPDTQTFYRLLNAGNQHAFGGLGMPAWVQLDCCTLPTAMIGYALPRSQVEPALYAALLAHVERCFGAPAAEAARLYDGLVPISEYTALSTQTEGTVVGFSLFSLLPGGHLGIRTKALALLCYGAKRQVGLTQYNNNAVKTHVLLGPLRITAATAAPHSRPLETFLYQVELHDPRHLQQLLGGSLTPPAETRGANTWVAVQDPVAAGEHVRALLEQHATVHVVAPGISADQRLCLDVQLQRKV